MAISSTSRIQPKQAQVVQREKDRVLKDLSESKVIDTRVVVDVDTSILKTKQYIDGSDWEVTYYNQLAAKSDTIGALDPTINVVEQQYVEINRFNLKTTSAIPSGKMGDITGDASVIDFLPLVGDMFTTTLIGNIRAIFTVTEVTDKSYNLDRIYDITFKLDSTEVTNPDKFVTLKSRTVRVLHYDAGAIYSGTDPILAADAMNAKDYLTNTFNHMADRYVQDFKMQSNRNLLIMTSDGVSVMDQNIAYLFNQMTDRKYTVDFVMDDIYKSTVIDILLNSTQEYLNDAVHPVLVPPAKGRNYGFRFRGLIGLSVSYVSSLQAAGQATFRFEPTHSTLPVFKPSDRSYLFSADFYNSKTGVSLIEELLLDAINDRQLVLTKVKELVTAHYSYSVADQYMYVPFILFIMKYYINRTYSRG